MKNDESTFFITKTRLNIFTVYRPFLTIQIENYEVYFDVKKLLTRIN